MKMKKNLFAIAAVAMVAAVSCNKEIQQENLPVGEVVTFEASVDGAETRVALDGKVSKWEKGDKITIHNGTTGYMFSTTDEGATADFTYAGDDFTGEKFMAVSPAGTYTADVEAKTVTAAIPTYQPSRDGNFSVGAVPSVAYTETQSLSFRNAATLLKFTVKGKNVKGLIFYGNNGEAVSGNIEVSLNDDNTIKSIAAKETTITENDVTETKLITWAKVWAQTENWCFNEGVTYYLSVVPQKFEKGFAVDLELDGVGVVQVKKLETAYELKPNTIVNLGELEYVAVTPEHSGWSLPGGYNGWNTAGTFLYEEGDYYVAKNVSGLNAGFKFQHAEYGWKGVGSEAAVAAGQWHKLNGDSNISLADAKAYDIYMTKDGNQFQAVAAGSPAPEAPVVVADYWGLIGSMANSNWSTDIKLAEEGDYLVVRSVALKTTDEFKFRKNGLWNEQRIAKGALASANVEYDFVDAGSGNMKISAAGTYDIYVKKDLSKVYFMTDGKTPDQAGQPDLSNTYRFYVQNNVGWSTLNFYAWGGYASAGWPGDKMTKSADVEGYGNCKYIEITKGVNVVNFIVNNGSKQTKDLKVSGNANVTKLANGDYVYTLTSADVK
jgi:hypothetical protein